MLQSHQWPADFKNLWPQTLSHSYFRWPLLKSLLPFFRPTSFISCLLRISLLGPYQERIPGPCWGPDHAIHNMNPRELEIIGNLEVTRSNWQWRKIIPVVPRQASWARLEATKLEGYYQQEGNNKFAQTSCLRTYCLNCLKCPIIFPLLGH